MNKRFVYFVIFSFSLFFGISNPNLKATEEITSENINEQKPYDIEEQEIGTRYFILEEELGDETDVEESQENDDDEDITKEESTSRQTTIKRTVLKSAIETLATSLSHKYYAKTNPKEYGIEPFRYDELAKILLNLLIDETIPNPKSNWSQKLVEFMVPTITAFLIIDCTKESFAENEKFQTSDHKIKYIINKSPELGSKLFMKLLKKFFMVRFLQKPGTRSFAVADAIAIASTFYEFNTSGKTLNEIFLDRSCIKFRHAIEQVVLDQARILIESVDLGKHLNPRHRKKALGKIVQLFLKPQVQEIIFKADEYHKNLAS